VINSTRLTICVTAVIAHTASASTATAAEAEPTLSWIPDAGAAHAHGVATLSPGPRLGFGGGLEVLAAWTPLLVSLGGGFMWSTVDRPAPRRVTTEPDVALPPLDVDVEDRRLTLHTTARVTAPNGWMLRPYLEVQASTVRWSSVYTLRFAAGSNSTEVAQAVDWSLGWGWGLGLLLPADHRGHSYVAFGFRRHYEGRPTVRQPVDGSALVDPFPQALDMLVLGIVVEF